MDIDQAIRHLLTQVGQREAARIVADAFEYAAKRRCLVVLPAPDVVLTEDELAKLEASVTNIGMTAWVAFVTVRKTEPDHATLIRLGRQLSARYRVQGRQGSARIYAIQSPIEAPKA